MKARIDYWPEYAKGYEVKVKDNIFMDWHSRAWFETKEEAIECAKIMLSNPVWLSGRDK